MKIKVQIIFFCNLLLQPLINASLEEPQVVASFNCRKKLLNALNYERKPSLIKEV
jgi:hypothetical protein